MISPLGGQHWLSSLVSEWVTVELWAGDISRVYQNPAPHCQPEQWGCVSSVQVPQARGMCSLPLWICRDWTNTGQSLNITTQIILFRTFSDPTPITKIDLWSIFLNTPPLPPSSIIIYCLWLAQLSFHILCPLLAYPPPAPSHLTLWLRIGIRKMKYRWIDIESFSTITSL